MRFWRVYLLLAVSLAAGPATEPGRTGDFSVVFDRRSPLSDFQKLQGRLNRTAGELGADYKLSDEPFQVDVPEDYDGSAALGIVVYMVPDGTPDDYGYLMPILERHRLIFIGPRNGHLPLGVATGLFLDAVYNLEQRYNIDASRIYLIGATDDLEPMSWSLSDIIAGDVAIWGMSYYRKIEDLRGFPVVAPPPDDLLEKSKTRVHVLAFDTDPSPGSEYFRTHFAQTMSDDGFEHVVSNQVSHDQIMEGPWVEERLKELESVAAEKAAAAPSGPPPSEAQHLLKLAQMDIANQQPDMARDKLNQIIQQYPDDPAAQTAKDLLAQLQSQ